MWFIRKILFFFHAAILNIDGMFIAFCVTEVWNKL